MENLFEPTAVLLARVFLGILFYMQGYDKIFNIKLANVIETIRFEINKPYLPGFVFPMIVFTSSFIELIGGLLLIVGFMKYAVLALLGIDLLFVAIGMGMVKAMWNMENVFPRLILILFIMLCPLEWDKFSLDHFFLTLK